MPDHTPGLKAYVDRYKAVCDVLPYGDISRMVDLLWEACRTGRRIFTMGNGGHGNTASHMINDIAKHTVSSDDKTKVVADANRFKTMCLNDSMSFVTGIANDMGFEQVFAEQLANWVEPGDVVIGISASGNSENVLRAVRYANEHGGVTIGLCGFKGGKLRELAQTAIYVRNEHYGHVEDAHCVVCHCLAYWFLETLKQEG